MSLHLKRMQSKLKNEIAKHLITDIIPNYYWSFNATSRFHLNTFCFDVWSIIKALCLSLVEFDFGDFWSFGYFFDTNNYIYIIHIKSFHFCPYTSKFFEIQRKSFEFYLKSAQLLICILSKLLWNGPKPFENF